MNPTNFHKKQADLKIFSGKFRLFVTGLGAYSAIVLTTVSFLIVFTSIAVDKQTVEIKRLLSYLIIPAIFLPFYSAITTRTVHASIGYKSRQVIKRFLDVVIAALGLFSMMPLLLLIAIAIKIESPGPVLYRSKRVGQFGRLFDAYKFRTMYHQPSETPITRVGKFLCRFSIDELPLLYNVVEGELSLVGPRPRQPQNLDETIDEERKILSVKPGMTGLWQISRSPFNQAIHFDLQYVENWSLLLDLKILFKTTLFVLLNG